MRSFAVAILLVAYATNSAVGQSGGRGFTANPLLEECRSFNAENTLAACERLIRSESKNSDLYVAALETRASIRELRYEYDLAIADLTALIQHQPKSLWLRRRGFIYYNLGQAQLALKDLSTVTDPNELDSSYYFVRGHAYYAVGNVAAAASDYEFAIRKNKRHAIAIGSLGILRLYEKDADRAAELLWRAHNMRPLDMLIAIWLDEALRQAGRPSKVLDSLMDKHIDHDKSRSRLVALFTGRATVEDALAATKSDYVPYVTRGRVCETTFFIGIWQRRNNNMAAAGKAFGDAIKACSTTALGQYVVRARKELGLIQRK